MQKAAVFCAFFFVIVLSACGSSSGNGPFDGTGPGGPVHEGPGSGPLPGGPGGTPPPGGPSGTPPAGPGGSLPHINACGFQFDLETNAARVREYLNPNGQLVGTWLQRSGGFGRTTHAGVEYFSKNGFRVDPARNIYGEVQILFRDLFPRFDPDVHRAAEVLEESARGFSQVKLSRPLSGHGYDGFRVVEIHRAGAAPSSTSCRTFTFRIEEGNSNQIRISRPMSRWTNGNAVLPSIVQYQTAITAPHQVTHDRMAD